MIMDGVGRRASNYINTGTLLPVLDNRGIYNPAGFLPDFKEIPWRPYNKEYEIDVIGLHNEILDFVDYITPNTEEQHARQLVVSRIKSVVHNIWPDCQVDVFGSFKTGLYLPSSDIDMVIFGNWSTPPLHMLERALSNSGISSDIMVLDKASVPIVKMTDKETDLRVDISFNMLNSVKAADLIRIFMETYPCLPHLVFVLKQFLLQRNLNEVWTGGLSSYALILMCVSFLQQNTFPGKSYECINLGTLLIEFFELYGRLFNYLNTAIRVTNGGEYVKKEVVQQNMEHGLRPSVLCIEDPLCPGNDVGRRSYCMLQVKQAFEYAYVVLSSAVLPQYRFLHGRSDVSILGRIIRIPPKSVEYRQRIRNYGRRFCFPLPPLNGGTLPKASSVFSTCTNPAFESSVVTVGSSNPKCGSPNDHRSPTASPINNLHPITLSDSTTNNVTVDNCPTFTDHLSTTVVEKVAKGSVQPLCETVEESFGASSDSRSSPVPAIKSDEGSDFETTDGQERRGECSILIEELASLTTFKANDGNSTQDDMPEKLVFTSVPSGEEDKSSKRRCLRPTELSVSKELSVSVSAISDTDLNQASLTDKNCSVSETFPTTPKPTKVTTANGRHRKFSGRRHRPPPSTSESYTTIRFSKFSVNPDVSFNQKRLGQHSERRK